MVAQIVEQLVEPVAQRLLVLPQLAHRIARMLRLPWPALLAALRVLLPLILALLEGAVAQILLLADHVAKLVELRHHGVAFVAVHIRRRHLQVFHHLLQLLQQRPRGVLGAALGQIFQPVEHALQIALAQHVGIGIERAGQLLAVLHLLGHGLHEAVHRRAQLVHQRLDLVVAGAAFERLLQRVFGVAQRVLRGGNVAVLQPDRHLP